MELVSSIGVPSSVGQRRGNKSPFQGHRSHRETVRSEQSLGHSSIGKNPLSNLGKGATSNSKYVHKRVGTFWVSLAGPPAFSSLGRGEKKRGIEV